MVTPRELREAAERELKGDLRILKEHERFGLGTDFPVLNSKIAICEHILATVRDDDDEPVSEEWFKSIGMQWEEADKCFFLRNHIGITSFHGGFWFFDYEDGPGWEIKTRRQFRRLCEGLGITLKEAT